MNRRGFLFGLGATIAIVPAASLMRIAPPKLILPPAPSFVRWMPPDEFATHSGVLLRASLEAVRAATQLPPEMLGSERMRRL